MKDRSPVVETKALELKSQAQVSGWCSTTVKRFPHRTDQTDHHPDNLDPNLPVLRGCAGSVQYRSNAEKILDHAAYAAPPGNMSYIIPHQEYTCPASGLRARERQVHGGVFR